MLTATEVSNYELFRDCLSHPIIRQSAPSTTSKPTKRNPAKGRKNALASVPAASNDSDISHQSNDTTAEDLADFIDYIASEIFPSLPPDLRSLSYATLQTTPSLADPYTPPLPASTLSALLPLIPPSATDSLLTYALLPDSDPLSLRAFLAPILTAYISLASAPPPTHKPALRAAACEICERDWVPLTYHHLIPKSTHQKAVKRGWHEQWRLESVAWLCRACHSFVHARCANEELAREWWSVERLMGREDVRAWKGWVGRVRWKAR